MSFNIRSFEVGSIFYQSGKGYPTHIATKGCIYIDIDTTIEYINKDGLVGWVPFLDGNTTSLLSVTEITISSFTLTTSFNYYGVNYNGNVNLTLPNPSLNDGFNLNIKDEGGYSGTYRIRITSPIGTIDNNPYVDMNSDNMSLHMVARNNNWWII